MNCWSEIRQLLLSPLSLPSMPTVAFIILIQWVELWEDLVEVQNYLEVVMVEEGIVIDKMVGLMKC